MKSKINMTNRNLRSLVLSYLVICGGAFFSLSLPAASSLKVFQSKLESLDAFWEDKVQVGRIAGVEYLLADESKILRHEAIGFRDLENKEKLELNSIFRLYSTTKPITKAAVLILADQGQLALEDPVHKFIPEFKDIRVLNSDGSKKTIPLKRDVTVFDLLVYLGGTGYIEEYWEEAKVTEAKTLKERVERINSYPLQNQPGEAFLYGVQSDVLAHIVEIVSGKPFNEFLRDRLFTPLEMHDTGYIVPSSKRERHVPRYRFNREEKRVELRDGVDDSIHVKPITCFRGSTDLVSTVSDYMNFARMLLNDGVHKNSRVLSKKAADLLTTNHLPEHLIGSHRSIRENGWGMGGAVVIDDKHAFPKDTYFKSGGDNKMIWVDKRNKLIGVILYHTNGQYYLINRFIREIYQEE